MDGVGGSVRRRHYPDVLTARSDRVRAGNNTSACSVDTMHVCLHMSLTCCLWVKKRGVVKFAQVKLTVSQDIHCASGATWRTHTAQCEGCHKVSRVEKHTEPTHYIYTAAYRPINVMAERFDGCRKAAESN